MRDVIIKCGKGEVKKTLASIEKKDSSVRWASEDKPTGYGSRFEKNGVYLVIENDVLTFIYVDEFENFDKKGKTVVSADEFLGKGKNPSIVIFRRDRNVIAKNTATGDEGVAKCSPADDFCFKTGASIALARLMAKTPEVITDDVRAEWKKVLGVKDGSEKIDRNFKAGDRVVVRDWDDMKKEYGVYDGSGTIKCPNGFTVTMKHLCGRTATVVDVNGTSISVDFDDKSGDVYWSYTKCMFNPIDANKSDDGKIHEGDTVKVINTGLSYTTYPQWVGKYISDSDMAARYCFDTPDTFMKYKVIKIAKHEDNGRPLAYIEEIDGRCYNSCHLIEVKGLEKV